MARQGDQIEFRVDRRQLVLFFLGGVVWTLLAFFVGMVVSGGSSNGMGRQALSSLGWLDAHRPLARAERTQTALPTPAGYTFHESLRHQRKNTPLTLPAPQEAQGRVPPKVRTEVAEKAAPRIRPVPRRKVAALPPPKQPTPPTRQALIRKNSAAAQKQHKTQQGKESSFQAVPARKESGEAADEAPPKKIALAERMVPMGQASYTMQVVASRQMGPVLRLLRRLKKRGYHPLLTVSKIPNKGRWYRLTVGSFPNRRTALRFSRQFRQQESLLGIVVSVR